MLWWLRGAMSPLSCDRTPVPPHTAHQSVSVPSATSQPISFDPNAFSPLPPPALNHHQADISAHVSVPKECLTISWCSQLFPHPFQSRIICASL